ncbi:hypothetical protein ACAW74_21540 [Fibrella sp. WM1]|uniref:hypothetical protein n=1 Tax=Fibrella musci TaxID=3242485 RepID=UPI003522BBBD
MNKGEANHVQIAIGALAGEVVLTAVLASSTGQFLILFSLLVLAGFAVGCWNLITYVSRSSEEENIQLGILISTLLPLAYLVFLLAFVASSIGVD